uniref:Kazal-like domain-containing protein n=1 Tax=Rhabditophanes sp. KR3021 TaxID=114890 RepID=A0AC35UFL1_9BILA
MNLINVVAILVALTSINASPANRLIQIACERNPALEMCASHFRMRDSPMEQEKHHSVPLVIPPSVSDHGVFRSFRDVPLSTSDKDEISELIKSTLGAANNNHKHGRGKLPQSVIDTCTPDCTSPHCTMECKCAKTHPTVHAKCNPPANSEAASSCQIWYNRCTMYAPVQY